MIELNDSVVDLGTGVVTFRMTSGTRRIECLARIKPWDAELFCRLQHELPMMEFDRKAGELFKVEFDLNRIVISSLQVKPGDFYTLGSDWRWHPDNSGAWDDARGKRNALLVQSDWTQLPDVPIATKDAWAVYRQQLRDVTLQSDPFNIVWPVPPT